MLPKRKVVVRGQPKAPAREEPHLRDKDASTFTRVFRGIRHVGQEREQFRCELRVTKLSLRVPEPKRVNIEWVRGPKRLYSQTANTLHKGVWTCSWAAPLILTATLFYHEDGQTQRQYASKTTKIRFVDLGRQLENLGEVSFDLAEVAQAKERDISITLPLHKSLDPNSTVSFSLRCIPIGDGSESGDEAPSEGSGTHELKGFQAKPRFGSGLLPDPGAASAQSPLSPAGDAPQPTDKSGLFRRRSMIARHEVPAERSLSFPPSVPAADSLGDETLTESGKVGGGASPLNKEHSETQASARPVKGVSQPDLSIPIVTAEKGNRRSSRDDGHSRKALPALDPLAEFLDMKDPVIVSVRDFLRGNISNPEEEARTVRLVSQKYREQESKYKHTITELEEKHRRERVELQKELKARAASPTTKDTSGGNKSEGKLKAAENQFFEVPLVRTSGSDLSPTEVAIQIQDVKSEAAEELREARKAAAERTAQLEAFVLEQRKAFKTAKLTWEHKMAEMQNRVKSLEKQIQVHEQWSNKRSHEAENDDRSSPRGSQVHKLEEELRRLQLKRIEEKRLTSDEVRTHLAASKTLKNELDLQRRKHHLFERTLKERIAMLEVQLSEMRESRKLAETQLQAVETTDAAEYEGMTKAELVSKLRRLEGSPSTGKDQKRVADLEEELIRAKISVAQAETEKDQVVEQARKRIESLKSALQQYDKTVKQLEEQLTAAKMRQLEKKGGNFGMKHMRSRGPEKDQSPETHKSAISRTASSELPRHVVRTKDGRHGSYSDALTRNR